MDGAEQMSAKAGSAEHARRAARRLGWAAYAAQAAGLALYIFAIWAEVFVDTKAAQRIGVDGFAEGHRHWRLRTSWLFLIWTVVGGLALPFGIGVPVLAGALLWYGWRVGRGMVCYARGIALGPPRGMTVRGGKAFIHKGTNGRWREVLSPGGIARCDEVAACELTPDCAHWLKTGELP